jgi:ABC-type Zn uptake system ZnuABC Zn-binding protein ZnuA
MSNDLNGKEDPGECLFHASQYLIITLISDLTNVRDLLSDGDGSLAKDVIINMKDNIGLLDKIADEFIDLDNGALEDIVEDLEELEEELEEEEIDTEKELEKEDTE